VARGSRWRYRDDGSDQGTAWRAPGFNDAAWKEGPAQLGYGDGDEATVVGYGPDANDKYPTTYFRRAFDVADASEVIGLTLRLVRDDGAAVYLNGVEAVPRSNLPAGDIGHRTYAEGPGVPVGGADESAFLELEVSPDLLVDGRNVVAVEVHQANATSTDLSFDLELAGLTAGSTSPPVVLDGTTTVRARVRSGAEWGALTEARFTVGLKGLVINEVMASNRTTLEDRDEPGEYPDWIEVYNGTSATLDLGGMYLTDDLLDLTKWRIAGGLLLGSRQHLVFLADDDGTQGELHLSYQLSQSGETIALVDRDGKTIIDRVVFDAQTADVSYGRYPDAGAWGFCERPTPYLPNRPHAP
ncbi:MAG: lamin tail domain-containing protein, partial [Planctomycetes bacterium]|nr:lamin tail domain-containing protein [Planctomycetota bacterium]